MPELPSLGNLPQGQYDLIVETFPGPTLAEKAQQYKDWHTNRLLDRVEEWQQRKAQFNIHASLPPRKNEPAFPNLP